MFTDFHQPKYILFLSFGLGFILKIFFSLNILKTSILIKYRRLPLGLTKSNSVTSEGMIVPLLLEL